MKKIKLFAMAVAAIFASSISAKDPSAALDVAEVASGDYYETECVPDIKNLDWVGYNSTGSGTGSILSGTRWKLNNSRTITFKVKNCGAVELQVEFAKDATTSVKYSINGATAEQFVTNGDDKKCVKVGSFKTGTKDEFSVTISSTQDLLLGYVRFYLPEDDAPYPFVKSFTVADVEAAVDTANHTISAELPYGADRTDAIANAEVIMGGTAKTYSISGDVLTAIDSVDTGKNIDYDLSGIVVAADPSDDATLSMITIDGADLAGFDPATLNYQMLADVIPTVAAVANDPNAIAVVEQAAELPGAATITVTAQDGETKLIYTVTFTSADKICGQLVKVTVASGKAGTIIGGLPATADVSLSSSGKMDSGKYFGITLTQGAFKMGDIFNVNTSTAAGQGILALYADKAMTTPVYEGENYGVAGDNLIILPEAADGLTTLYMARNDAINKWNGVISFIEVTRDCEPKLLAFSLKEVDAEIDQEAKTVTAELPYGTVLEESDWDNAYTLNGAATDAEYNQEHTTLTVNGDDASVVYTLDITIAQSASDNANLSEITVNGKAIAGFRADSLEYAFELPNGTVDLPVIAAVAEDITAEVVIDEITALDQLVEIVVTAQDGVTVLTYKVQLSVASAPKYLYEAVFSNGAKGAIDNDAAAIIVPYLDGEAYPTLVSDSVTPGASAEQTGEDKILVTGSDLSTKEFSIEFRALSAPTFTADTITFDGSESYIFAFYGWHAEKGVIFSKAVNEDGNMRITTGKTRVYMALPACYKVNLISGTGGARDIKVSLNGGEPAAMKTAAKNAGMDILLSSSETNFLAIESNQTSGDGGFIKMVLTLEEPQPTKLVEAAIKAQAERFMSHGVVYFRHNAKVFNMMGQEIRF